MPATIKISPTFKDYFNELEYQLDINSYYDMEFYLQSMHPKFSNYMAQIKSGLTQEGYAYLDKDLNVVEQQSFSLKKVNDGDIIYIAPVICGGGGKKGFIFAAIAIVAIGFATGGFSGLFANPMAGLTGPEAFIGGNAIFGGGAVGGGGLFAGMPGMLKGMLGNMALSAIGMLFTSKPKQQQMEVTKDSGTRTENNMFGSLTNTTTSGTPIQLNYGTMRVAGQYLSGYIVSQSHGQNDSPTVQALFTADSTPLSTSTGDEA